MPEAERMLVATWVKSSVWKWVFTKVLARAPSCSSWFWEPSPKSFIQDVPGKTCMQMTWSSSLNHWRNWKRSWSPLEDQHRREGTLGQPGQNLISGPGLDVLQKSGKEPCGLCLKGVQAQTPFFVAVAPVGSTRIAAVPRLSEAWSRCKRCSEKARPIDGRLLWQRSQWGGKSLRWCHLSVTLGTAYAQGAVVNSLLSQDVASHGANSASFCLSSPPAHFPSPPEEEFTIHVSVMLTGSGDYTDLLRWNNINN